jgi:hypothetical protein
VVLQAVECRALENSVGVEEGRGEAVVSYEGGGRRRGRGSRRRHSGRELGSLCEGFGFESFWFGERWP